MKNYIKNLGKFNNTIKILKYAFPNTPNSISQQFQYSGKNHIKKTNMSET